MGNPAGHAAPIIELPAAEVRRICAGEVVERPLNIVKELIENALDAEATEIDIELEDGGKRLIRVTDNGLGIPFDELPLAIRPHCTSKIRCLDDVFALATLGFRGEALSSISAVTRLTLTSRSGTEELGGRVETAGGDTLSHVRVNLQPGTEVVVRDLFFNTPARLKFLRSRQAETAQVSSLLTSYALAYPEIRWRLTSGGRTLLATDGDGETRALLADLLGPEVGRALVPIDFEFPPSAVHGFISAPAHHRHNRTRQWYFVNRRPVVNKLLYRAVDDAVREFVSPGKHPAGTFFLQLPPEEIDVNVHPMKSEVSFAQPQGVYSLLATAVRRALGAAAQAQRRDLHRGLSTVIMPAAKGGMRRIPVYEADQPIVPPGRAEPPSAEGADPAAGERESPSAVPEVPSASPQDAVEPGTVVHFPGRPQRTPPADDVQREATFELIAQVAGTYLVAATDQELFLIDQHAAHERLLFDELYPRIVRQHGPPVRQRLLFPVLVPLSAGEAQLTETYLEALTRLGFSAQLGAGPSLVVREVPLVLARTATAELIHGILADLAGEGSNATLDDRLKALASALACRAAVKAGEPLPPAERVALVRRLLSGAHSLTCPHGRPAIMRLDSAGLARLFQR